MHFISCCMAKITKAKAITKDILAIFRSFIRPLLPFLLAILFCLIAAAVFYTLSHHFAFEPDPRTTHRQFCLLEHKSFGAHLFYVISLCSTIGYGNLFACSSATKIFTVTVSLVGLPLVVYIVVYTGNKLEKVVRTFYGRYSRRVKLVMYRRFSRTSKTGLSAAENAKRFLVVYLDPATAENDGISPDTEDTNGAGAPDTENDVDLPLWIGCLVLLVCCSICATYYRHVEEYSLEYSIYFAFLTFLTGDFTVTHYSYALPMYFVIFAGFTMLSLTINAFLGNIKNAVGKIKKSIEKQINDAPLGADGSLELPPGNELIENAMKEHGGGGMMTVMMPASLAKDLESFCESAVSNAEAMAQMKASLAEAQKSTVETQDSEMQTLEIVIPAPLPAVRPLMYSQSVMAKPESKGRQISCNPSVSERGCQKCAPLGSDVSIQVDPVPPSVRSVGMQYPRPSKWYKAAAATFHDAHRSTSQDHP